MSSSELLVGDPAPAIEVETFLKGEPLTGFAPGCVYVVEFWATWCGPCATSIPHLTELQARYPNVPILGVAVGWTDLMVVESFVRDWNDRIGYRIAVDRRPEREVGRSLMRAAWCDAAFQKGVPTSFIVDRAGRIAWIGHPMDLDTPLAAVEEGRWDLAAAADAHRSQLVREKVREAQALERAVRACSEMGDRDGMLRAYDAAFATEPELEPTYGFGKFKQFAPGGEAALVYGQHLITRAAANDINTLFKIGMSLTRQGETLREPVSEPAAALAIQALDRVWSLAGSEPNPRLRMRLSEAYAYALLAAGRRGEAMSYARAALDAGKATGANEEVLAPLQALHERCVAATPSVPTPPPSMICDGDSCRLADS
ncbi:TlpA family protein disulfide reductase [Methylobacterium sp. Leaf113]|uniref:TlpA family protein disulfide reductase n=1 Tax=Methylobacterium sp. Leaf113 TaxID=1736259 RepID=UPI0009E85B94|nr:TlpA disulfide reductase family protein [Methylobacterium sp. Leaf113]